MPLTLKNFFSQKSLIINSFLIFILCLIITSDIKIFVSIVFGLIFGGLGFKISVFLKTKAKIPRLISCFFITFFFGIIIFFSLYFLAEIFLVQTGKLFSLLTNQEFLAKKILYFQKFFENLNEKINLFKISHDFPKKIINYIDVFIDSIPIIINQNFSRYSLLLIKNSYIPGLKIFNLIYVIFLSLIFSFFIMYDLERILILKDKIFGIYSESIQKQIDSFKSLVSKMLIGQIKVALILFCFYSLFFWFLKFEYFILFSLIFSIFTLIPIVGSFFSILILILSFYLLDLDFQYSLKLSGVFGTGYLIENLYLTPSLVGSSLNVHPIIILIGLILFSKFFGIWGMFFALPVIAFLTRIVSNYLSEIKVKKESPENGLI
jgi:predicted PurR-regulated permease PerM